MDYYKLFDSKQLFTMFLQKFFLMSHPLILVAKDNDFVPRWAVLERFWPLLEGNA